MKTFKGLYIENGLIKAGEFPVEPEKLHDNEDYDAFLEHQEEIEIYRVAVNSAKANAVECEDQTLAATLTNGVKECDVFVLPSGWDYVEKVRVCTDDCTCAEPCIVRVVAKLYRTDEKKPHGFCEKPNSTCTMNYCDENGCNERKRVLSKCRKKTPQ